MALTQLNDYCRINKNKYLVFISANSGRLDLKQSHYIKHSHTRTSVQDLCLKGPEHTFLRSHSACLNMHTKQHSRLQERRLQRCTKNSQLRPLLALKDCALCDVQNFTGYNCHNKNNIIRRFVFLFCFFKKRCFFKTSRTALFTDNRHINKMITCILSCAIPGSALVSFSLLFYILLEKMEIRVLIY